MTITTDRHAGNAEARGALGKRLRAARESPRFISVVRIAWILACTMLAFSETAEFTLAAGSGGDLSGYGLILPALGLATMFGIALRRGDELPIHDRQIDSIVGGITLIIAVSIQWLLLPRYTDLFLLLRIDLLASIVFMLGASILMFGLRPAGRFWPSWLLMLAISPLPFRLLSILFGGLWHDQALAALLITALGMAIAVGRTRKRAIAGAIATLVVGGIVLAVLIVAEPNWEPRVMLLLPSIIGALVVGVAIYLQTGHAFSRRGLPHGRRAYRALATTTGMWRASGVVLGVAIVISVISLPDEPVASAQTVTQGPASGALPDGALVVPSGWRQVEQLDYPWVTRFFGDQATLIRQELLSQTPNPEWDAQSRPRTIMVDTITTDRPAMLSVYAEDTLYPTSRTRISPSLAVDLGHGITGQLYTIVDEEALLTWTKLTFDWHRDGQFQRISAITVDNHLATAEFPAPMPSMASDITNTLNVLFRGNSVTENDQPEYKDLPLLTVFGRDLVRAQMEPA